MRTQHELSSAVFTPALFVATLGYFVDVFDLLLFAIVRVPSLRDLGVAEDRLLDVGLTLINMQMFGMLLGGILWGIWGDKRGRVSVLFGSILLYSLANIANAFVAYCGDQVILAYGILRLLAGIGLAGELGAAITLITETLTSEKRGYGTAIVASLGLMGGGVASLVSEYMSWQTAYLVGGCMGLLLLVMRLSIRESSFFTAMDHKSARGDLRLIFYSPKSILKYLRCVLIGTPTWFTIGILVTFSPELSKALGVHGGSVSAAKALFYAYLGISLGDLLSGLLSQWLRSRKKAIFIFLMAAATAIFFYLVFGGRLDQTQFYALCFFLGLFTGYWAVFVTTASEQFGTNIRATVTTTAPNFVRGSVVLLTLAFEHLSAPFGLIGSAALVGTLSLTVALYALFGLEETYGKNLNFLETL